MLNSGADTFIPSSAGETVDYTDMDFIALEEPQ